MALNPRQVDRYARQLILPGWTANKQELLGSVSILLVGAGGLGSAAGFYLAGAGIGHMTVVDDDVVSRSNLHRQILHADADLGSPKVDSAAARLTALNPDLRLTPLRERITPTNATQLVESHDIVVDGSDNFATRFLLGDACALAGVPYIHAAVVRFSGQVTSFVPGPDRPCYRCLFPDPPEVANIPSCADAGVIGPLVGILGSWQAMEAIKLITNIGERLVGKLQTIDALTNDVRTIAYEKSPDCPLCGPSPAIVNLDPARYAALEVACPPGAPIVPSL